MSRTLTWRRSSRPLNECCRRWPSVVDVAGKRIALVGGAGFIGHSLAIQLKELGAEVDVIDGLTVNNLLHYTGLPPDSPNRDLYIKIIEQRLSKLRMAEVPL